MQQAFDKRTPSSVLWFGDNPHKGLGIFSFNGFELKKHRAHQPQFKIIVPVVVKKDDVKFTLFAIWAHNPGDPDGQYITQVWKAVKHYDRLIKRTGTILTGDFNSNSIWDRPKRAGNHTTVVDMLQRKGIQSVYHLHHRQQQGAEKHPTLYLYRHKDKPYHLDYCFVSADFLSILHKVEIGSFAKWKIYSDHSPLVVQFNATKQ